jgi:integrase
VCGAEHIGRHFKRPKTSKGRRWVPLAGPAKRALEALRSAQLVERAEFGADYQDHDLIFCLVDGLPLRPDSVTRDFTAKAAACSLPTIRLQDMRHGACSLMLSGGVPVEIVQMILGHSSPAVTRRVYAHLMRPRQRRSRRPSGVSPSRPVSNQAESAGSSEARPNAKPAPTRPSVQRPR